MADKTISALCPTCDGEGVVDSIDWIECAACDFTGKILGESCPCCRGEGVQEVDIKSICPECGGESVVYSIR